VVQHLGEPLADSIARPHHRARSRVGQQQASIDAADSWTTRRRIIGTKLNCGTEIPRLGTGIEIDRPRAEAAIESSATGGRGFAFQ
jgi:hypothetical protein